MRRGARLRGGASVAALLAAGALLAGCGTAAPDADAADREPAPAAAPAADSVAGDASGAVKDDDQSADGTSADDTSADDQSADDQSSDDQGSADQGTSHRSDNGSSQNKAKDKAKDKGQDKSQDTTQGKNKDADDQGQDDQGGDDQGEDGDDQGQDEQGEGGDAPTTPAVELPPSWAGTYSAESMPAGNGYLVVQNLYLDQRGATSMDAAEIQGIEFFGGTGTTCEGTATLEGDTALCHMPNDGRDRGPQDAVVHLVPAAFGGTSLLLEVGVDHPLGVSDAPQGIGSLVADEPGQVTEEDAESAMITAVMMADSPEGPLPEELSAQCELLDGGEHALCEVTGTPDGGGDGTWYGTVQPGYGWMMLYATQLP